MILDEMKELRIEIKKNIVKLMENQEHDKAEQLLNQYLNLAKDDPEAFSIQAVLFAQKDMIDKAMESIESGLKIDKINFDLLYNQAYLYEQREDYQRAGNIYKLLVDQPYQEEQRKLASRSLEKLEELGLLGKYCNKPRLVFFIKPGLDGFIDEIIQSLSQKYATRKVIVTQYNQIDTEMEQADICWFEWCDELVGYGSKLNIAKEKLIVCRLHSYEAFTNYAQQVLWDNVDKIIFVAEHIKKFVLENTPTLSEERTIVIPNGLDVSKYHFKDRTKGFNIAYVGYINYKKGPMLLLHVFKAIHDRDPRYKLYIAGTFQDARYVLYFRQLIQEFKLENNVFYQGWQDNIDQWLEDKNYIICTSVLESQNLSVMQAMAKGIKPLVHNFVGARNIYPAHYIWSSISQCIDLINKKNYNSNEYRQFIKNKYSFNEQSQQIQEILNDTIEKQMKYPLVTIGVVNYNQENYLEECLQSILKQNYPNKEVLIIDDCSTDASVSIIKKYTANFENIKLIEHDINYGNGGKGAQDVQLSAKGKYFTYIDADDYYASDDVITSWVNELEGNKTLDFVYGNLKVVDQKGNILDIWKSKSLKKEEVIHQVFQRMGSNVMTMIGLYRTAFYKENNLTIYYHRNLKIGYDTLNCIINMKNNWNFKHIDKDVLCYRRHTNNVTSKFKERIICTLRIAEYIVENFDETIYLPEVNWNILKREDRKATKSFYLGIYFLEVYKHYRINLFDNVDLELLKDKAEKYFKESLNLNYKYKHVILEKLEEINNRVTPKFENSVKSTKQEIVLAGNDLRNNLLDKYKQCYKNKNYNMLILSPNNGAWKYSFVSWKSILEWMGVNVDIIYEVNEKYDYSKYNILISIGMKHCILQLYQNKSLTKIRHRIGIAGKDDFSEVDTANDIWAIDEIADRKIFQFLISTFDTNMVKKIYPKWLQRGICIKSITFGFNPLIHFPENREYVYDYFFVGHNSYRKVEETQKYLLPIINRYSGLLGGTGWGNNIVEINPNTVRDYYNQSKINLNFHLDIQKRYNYEVNERTYIICACGGFQLVDNPGYLYNLYNGKEIAIAKDSREYMEMFEYYLHHEHERLNIAYNGLVKTYQNKSSLFERLENILNELNDELIQR